MSNYSPHRSVLLQETVAGLNPVPGGVYVDATFGGGGHSRALLEQSAPTGIVIGLDRDPEAIANGAALQAEFGARLRLIHTPFSGIAPVVAELGYSRVAGVVFDLGVSSHQLDTPERGFSFQGEGPLDMRMDQGAAIPTAGELLERSSAEELAEIFFVYGEERYSRRIARQVVAERMRQPLVTTHQLARLVERTVLWNRKGSHPATRVFQALRIAVNRELDELARGVEQALELLAVGGRVAVIAFHSLEDRIVKQKLRLADDPGYGQTRMERELAALAAPVSGEFRLVTRRPVTPTAEELAVNPRARSARLRVAERIREAGR